MLKIVVGILIGMLVPLKTIVNLRLGKVVNALSLTALSTFSGGILSLLLINLVVEGKIYRNIQFIFNLPWWSYCAGICAAIALMINSFLFRKFDLILIIGITGASQLIAGTVIDSFGLLGTHYQELSLLKLQGVILTLLGVAIIIYKHRVSSELLLLSFCEGIFLAVSTAIISYTGNIFNSIGTGSLFSLLISLLFTIIIVIKVKSWLKLRKIKGAKLPLWSFSGGIFEGVTTYLKAKIVPIIGNSRLATWVMIGKILIGLIINKKKKLILKKSELIGLLLVIIGTSLIELDAFFNFSLVSPFFTCIWKRNLLIFMGNC